MKPMVNQFYNFISQCSSWSVRPWNPQSRLKGVDTVSIKVIGQFRTIQITFSNPLTSSYARTAVQNYRSEPWAYFLSNLSSRNLSGRCHGDKLRSLARRCKWKCSVSTLWWIFYVDFHLMVLQSCRCGNKSKSIQGVLGTSKRGRAYDTVCDSSSSISLTLWRWFFVQRTVPVLVFFLAWQSLSLFLLHPFLLCQIGRVNMASSLFCL